MAEKKTLWPHFMDGVQHSQGYRATTRRHFTFYQFPQQFLVQNWSTSEGWKAKLTLEPLSGWRFSNVFKPIGEQCSHHIEPTQLIFPGIELNCFYMMETLVGNKLIVQHVHYNFIFSKNPFTEMKEKKEL